MTNMLAQGTAVWMAVAGITVAGRVIGSGPLYDGDTQFRIVVDQCTLGQHLPQWYRPAELHPLTAAACPQLGLCPECLGYGTIGELCGGLDGYYPYGIDEVPDPCEACGGSGRTWVRVTVERGDDQTTGRLTVIPHHPVFWTTGLRRSPLPVSTCLACGIDTDAHPDPDPEERGQ